MIVPLVILVLAVVVLGILFVRARHAAKRAEGQRARAAEGMTLVGQLAGGLAHEIRNPLNAMNLNLQLLREDLQTVTLPNDSRVKGRIEVMLGEVKRLEGVLDDFLRFVKGPELDLVEHDLNSIVEDVLQFVAPEFHQNKITIHKTYAPSIPKCRLDAKLVKQAILNIVINAEQAMPDGGELMIRSSTQGPFAQLEIIDTGKGIPSEVLPRIFEAYFSTKKKGSGLGLAATKRIVDAHGGEVSVNSEVGRGSIFRVRLPIGGPGS